MFDKTKLERKVVLTNALGLHARCAAQMAKIAAKATSGVWVVKDGEKADAAGVLDILSLACPQGTEIKIKIDDPKDIHILESLCGLVKNGFGE